MWDGRATLTPSDQFTHLEYMTMNEHPIAAKVAQALLATTIVVAINAALAGAFLLQSVA
jgi:hypothetical protein